MISRVSPITFSRIFAASTVNVPSPLTLKPPLIEQVIQLDRLAAAVRFVDPEAQRSERRRQERRVHRLLESLVDLSLVDEILQREQA